VDKLTEGISTIAAAFWPKPVIVRLSDFKSNEYRKLIGGTRYEPDEENPMLGFRGASRYISGDFQDAFAMECEALKRVRSEMGLSNVEIMVPFVRTVKQAEQVAQMLAERGLKRGVDGLRLIMMCEVPSNAILAEQFLQHFDGMSIGSNDLTQLTLGLDRDSGLEQLAADFDERDPAVKALISRAITACRATASTWASAARAPATTRLCRLAGGRRHRVDLAEPGHRHRHLAAAGPAPLSLRRRSSRGPAGPPHLYLRSSMPPKLPR
jgi:pyruvate,water dikinase